MRFVSDVTYNGTTLYDTVDFLCPVLYQRFDEGSSAEARLLNGDRARQTIEMANILSEGRQAKPVVPTFAFEYEGGPLSNQNADRLNAVEMAVLIEELPNLSHFQIWHAFYVELNQFEFKRDRLIEAIREQGVEI